MIVRVLAYNYFTFSPHLLFSPDKPFTNVSADYSLAIHILASASTFYLLASASANLDLSPSTFSFNNLTLSLITANCYYLISNSAAAAAHVSYNGLTSLNILLYSIILVNHEHKYIAASLYVFINPGLNLGSLAGSLITLLQLSILDYSMFLPSNPTTLFKNLSTLFII